MDVKIEVLDERDAHVWERMRSALGPAWFTDDFAPVMREYFEHGMIDGLRHVVLVAREADSREIVGFAEVSLRDFAEGCHGSPVGYLEGWFVSERARGAGVGRALVSAGEAWAASRGCTEFASDAETDNSASIRAHHALGFEEVCAIVCFRKSIAQPGGPALGAGSSP